MVCPVTLLEKISTESIGLIKPLWRRLVDNLNVFFSRAVWKDAFWSLTNNLSKEVYLFIDTAEIFSKGATGPTIKKNFKIFNI